MIPTLIRHVATTARALERARANGGKLPPEEDTREETKGDERKDETDGKEASEGREGRDGRDGGSNGAKKKKKKQPLTTANLCARNALLVHTLYSLTKEAELEREESAWPTLLALHGRAPPRVLQSSPPDARAAARLAAGGRRLGAHVRRRRRRRGRRRGRRYGESRDDRRARSKCAHRPRGDVRSGQHPRGPRGWRAMGRARHRRRTDLIRVLVDVMALNRDANAKEDAKTADDEASARSTEGSTVKDSV